MDYTMLQAGVLYILLLAHFAHSCIYFTAEDLSEQLLVFLKNREDYCTLNATTKDGDSVRCKDNVTATRINSSHVLLDTDEELGNSTLILNYGKNGKNGLYAYAYKGACPEVVVAENKKKPKNGRERYGLYAALGLVALIIFIMYIKCKKDGSQKRGEAVCNGVKVDGHNEDMELNGAPTTH